MGKDEEVKCSPNSLTTLVRDGALKYSPPICLGEIYRRDILSFLHRSNMEKWRLVSRLSNSVIESTLERRLPRRRVDIFFVDSLRGKYNDGDIQPNGFISEAAVLKSDSPPRKNGPRIGTWNKPSPCLQWEFDPDRLEDAVSQLVGQPILVGGLTERPADEVISFTVYSESMRTDGQRYDTENYLQVVSQLTRETATSLLHLLHHLDNHTYLGLLDPSSRYLKYLKGSSIYRIRPMEEGTQINPAIFTALRQARGGRLLELYLQRRSEHPDGTIIFGEVELGGDVKLHYRP